MVGLTEVGDLPVDLGVIDEVFIGFTAVVDVSVVDGTVVVDLSVCRFIVVGSGVISVNCEVV